MTTVLTHATIYTGHEVIRDGYLRFDQQLQAVGPMSDYQPAPSDEARIDLAGQTVVPGFIDVHSHGGYGYDAMDGNADQINAMVQQMTANSAATSASSKAWTNSCQSPTKPRN